MSTIAIEPALTPKPKQVRIYLPTYQLNPKKRFSTEEVEKILKNIVESELEEVQYNDKAIPELCLNLAESIRLAIKEQNYNRYVKSIRRQRECNRGWDFSAIIML